LGLLDQKELLETLEYLVKMVRKERVELLVTKVPKDYLEEQG